MAVNLILRKQQYNNLKQNSLQERKKTQNFNGLGDVLTAGLTACDKNKMYGVAAIDLLSMITPRTVIDATRNGFAATETFLRESAGLIINCLIPGIIVAGMAKILQKSFMGKEFKNIDVSEFLVNQQSNDILTNAWIATKNSGNKNARVKAFVANVLDNVEGLAGTNDWKTLGNILGEQRATVYEKIADAITLPGIKKQNVTDAASELISKTHISKNLNFIETIDGKQVKSGLNIRIKNLVDDMCNMGSAFLKLTDEQIPTFNKKLTKLINAKSFTGLAIIIAMGASFQHFNRKLTKMRTGSEEFVGDKNYLSNIKNGQKSNTNKTSDKDKNGLRFKKLLGVSWMALIASLSFMKKPTLKMFQFNDLFPTFDQCRAISAVTYSGRILAATDENELQESALRDTFSFVNLYFLGDYVNKAFASFKEKFGGLKPGDLLKHTEALPEQGASIFKKFIHWFKHTELKSFDEIAHCSSKIKNNRAFAEASGLLYSCIVLGVLVPLYNKYRTNKAANAKEKTLNISTYNLEKNMTHYQKNLFTAFCRNSRA